VIGQLYIEGDLVVGGIVEGEVEATGDVEIADMAKTKASLAGRDVSINGHHTGPVVARKRLIVGRSGSLFGDVRVARLVIQDGATFSGKVSMGPAAVEARAPVKQLEALPAAQPAPQPQPEPKPAAAAAAPEKPMPTIVAPIVAPIVAARSDGKDGGKSKAAPPPPQQQKKGGKPKRR
jgi:cytoskeletal protein CcmA (bactofilin family)